MKTKSIILMLCAIGIALTSCQKDEINVVPSGNITSVEKTIGDFNALDISDLFNVFVTFSETDEGVVVEANDNLQSYIYVSKNGSTLNVELDDDLNIRKSGATLNIYITIHDLVNVEGSGAVDISLQNERVGDELHISLGGASSFSGNIQASRLTADLDGNSNINLSGRSDVLVFDANGASDMEGYDFETDKLEADMNGASNIHVTVNEKMDIRANGASYVYYKGNGIINSQNLNGASQIVKVD